MQTAPPALALVAAGALLAAGCESANLERHREMEEISARHEAELEHFEQQRTSFARRNPCPQRLEFPGQGTVLVHECTLRGMPGREQFWIKYTYLNSTGHVIEGARIVLKLRDSAGTERTESSDARLPLGLRLGPDSSWTTFTQIDLEGLSKLAELQWSVDVRAEVGTR
jgi:hypothetical protein